MELGFWKQLKKPIFVLAPMADVTDAAFRKIIAKYGKPDVFWTEFVSCDGLCSPGREVMLRDLEFSEGEHPIVAQLFGAHPDTYYKSAQLIRKLGFDGIDINMGCPDRNVEKQGAGAALIKEPTLAREIIRAAKEGAGGLPVSVKTRIGYNTNILDTWLPELLAEEPAVVTIHARTRKEMSKVPADWSTVAQAVEINNKIFEGRSEQPLILGNGDVENLQQATLKAAESGADGVMIGRGIFGNPWLFNRQVDIADVPLDERLSVLVEHTQLFEDTLGDIKNFAIMKKHYKAYVTGFAGAKELRMELMEAADAADIKARIETFLGDRSEDTTALE